jgi:hypothetical protein
MGPLGEVFKVCRRQSEDPIIRARKELYPSIMGEQRHQYDLKFKRNAVELCRTGGKSVS